jgi:hypothetical protein
MRRASASVRWRALAAEQRRLAALRRLNGELPEQAFVAHANYASARLLIE